MVEPAVIGTRNIIKACEMAKVKKLVVVSSLAAVVLNPKWPKDRPKDEECWSDREFCKTIEVSSYTYSISFVSNYYSQCDTLWVLKVWFVVILICL